MRLLASGIEGVNVGDENITDSGIGEKGKHTQKGEKMEVLFFHLSFILDVLMHLFKAKGIFKIKFLKIDFKN